MASPIFFDNSLTKADHLVLKQLEADIEGHSLEHTAPQSGATDDARTSRELGTHGCPKDIGDRSQATISALESLNDPNNPHFEPSVFNGFEVSSLPSWVQRCIMDPYIRVARSVVRVETDVVMVTHLLLYLVTSIPSALLLFWRFSWLHAVVHAVMQVSYVGTYTLMMHQHIHMKGIFAFRYALLDTLFPYVTDPLMGHTWNSYFYHHVKHHHAEGNGPDDLSSTLRYQRDDVLHFLHYVGRFYFFIWLDLPLYFVRKGRVNLAVRAAFWEISSYAAMLALFRINPRATTFVFLIPLFLLRAGLMVGNWGQHAFVDRHEPDSDYRSSITLIDVASNRHCFNDGYHTSHHLNPLRHWRDHPVAFLKNRGTYASEHALVFHNIDYIMITVRLLLKDYTTLAQCMVPIGDQIPMTLEDRVNLLKSYTRRFTEDELHKKFNSPKTT